jgi:hypothetical protein
MTTRTRSSNLHLPGSCGNPPPYHRSNLLHVIRGTPMKRSFVAFAPFVLLVAAAFGSTGCIIGECDNGQENCVQAETPVGYTGNDSNASAPYAAGQGVQITNVNGQIDVGVGSGDDIEVTFKPFTAGKDSQEGEDAAKDELANKLVLEVTGGDTVQIRVATRDGASSFLGAHVVVTLPASFDGAFRVDSNNGSVEANLQGAAPSSTTVVTDNGSIELYGARGQLTVEGGLGDVTVGVSAWGGDGEDGSVYADNGDIAFTVPSDADGTLTLVASDQISDSGVPGEKAENSGGISYTMGDGAGAHVDVTADFGSISAAGG